MEGLRKTMKYPSQNSQFLGPNMNPGHTEKEAGILSTLPWRLALKHINP
jgi:hypothetical protein